MKLHVCFFAAFAILARLCSGVTDEQLDTALTSPNNANHIFNAIHSATRQWGSSLHHNGFSFYLATVPEGTRLYHGRHDPGPLRGVDWVAFEPEHGIIFSSPFVKTPPGGVYPNPGDGNRTHMEETHLKKSWYGPQFQRPISKRESPHQPLAYEEEKGFLITYKAPKDLRLLYIDGLGGAKISKGTMDSQDHVLLNITETPDILYDGIRGRALCRLIKEEWESSLDGFIRMESGFEAIICSVEDSLVQERVQETLYVPSFAKIDIASTCFNDVRAAARAYDGYTDGRIAIDYDSLVSGYTYLRRDQARGEMPRLLDISNASRAKLREEVTQMVLHGPSRAQQTSINWQAITDKIVGRYAQALKYLLVPSVADHADSLLRELEHLINPFVDKAVRDQEVEVARCAEHDLPEFVSVASLSAQTVRYVSQRICSTLVSSAFELYAVQRGSPPKKDDIRATTVERVQALIKYLQWTVWKKCGGCADDRVCLVAMFPWGDQVDHDHPSCLNATQLPDRYGYWVDDDGRPK